MSADLVVVGAGVVGAASAYFASLAGLRVVVVERGVIAGGTSSAGEGNVLVSDKEAGPEPDLALYSQRVWREDLAEHADRWEFEAKGGLVVAASERSVALAVPVPLDELAALADDTTPVEVADNATEERTRDGE